jgi:hypothetical protein
MLIINLLGKEFGSHINAEVKRIKRYNLNNLLT